MGQKFSNFVCLGAVVLGSGLVYASPNSVPGSYMTVQVEPRAEECFYEELETGVTFVMEFEVIRGGLLDIDFKLMNPSSQIVFQKLAFFNNKDDAKNDLEGHVSYTVPHTGEYAICFDNAMSRWTPKVVSFFVADIKGCKTQLPGPDQPSEEMATLEHLSPFVDSVVHLSDELDGIERIQHHMRVREAVHRDTAESTNARVMWLSLLESFVLVSISVLQLFYIRQWFTDRPRRV